MAINRLTLKLEQIEYKALLTLAFKELRNPSDQAHFIIREQLNKRGLINTSDGLINKLSNVEVLNDN